MRPATLLKSLRVLHLYVGVFIAPAVLFFAFSGALQTFGLHETNSEHPNYTPAKWEVTLAQMHKHQTTVLPTPKRPSPAPPRAQTSAASLSDASGSDKPHKTEGQPGTSPEASPSPLPQEPRPSASTPAHVHNPVPLRIFFLFISIGLFISTLTGLYMAYKYNRNKLLVSLSLIAGAILPLLLLFV